jgi:transposase
VREIVSIHDLKKQGLSISAIARKVGCERRPCGSISSAAWRRRIYGPRQPRDRFLDSYGEQLRDRVLAFPDLSGARLLRKIRDLGYKADTPP